MTTPDEIAPEFHTLLNRSEELLATVKLMRESEPVDWKEVHGLHAEISELGDQMTEMLPPAK